MYTRLSVKLVGLNSLSLSFSLYLNEREGESLSLKEEEGVEKVVNSVNDVDERI